MHRTVLYSILVLLLAWIACAPTYVEKVITSQGGVVEHNGLRLEIPANSITDSVTVRIEIHGISRQDFEQDYSKLGKSFVIMPETLVFQKPARFSYEAQGANIGLGAEVGSGFVSLATSEASNGRVAADLWHGGEYYLIKKPRAYGIIDHAKTDEGLLIVADIYVSDYVRDFKQVLRQNGYDHPVWLFVYRPDVSIEDNALLLHDELKKLHGEYGEFRLDVVSFGIGGLVTHRYLTDSMYYGRDISSAVVAIGTPFFGSSFADIERAKDAESPYRFALIDGIGVHVNDLAPGSKLLTMVKEKRNVPGYHYYDDPSENKNFVSLHGSKAMDGSYPEETAGDGMVSVRSTMLTAIEPAAFSLDHFGLFDSKDVLKVATEFVLLYRGFNWPMLFSRVWKGDESFTKVNETWEREVKLHLRDDADFNALLEFNKNLLNSAPANALLITNGDYDTYPAWLLQADGIRTDVLIVNRSLLNLKDYARYLKKHGLPLDISERELELLEHKKVDDRFVSISDQLMKGIFQQTVRPVVLSTTVYEPRQYGYPLKLSGLVYEISESDIDVARTKHLLYDVFEFESLFSRPLDLFDANIQSMARNYAAVAYNLSGALETMEEYEDAIAALEFAGRFGEEPMFYYNEARIYFEMGERTAADSVLRRLLEIEAGDVILEREVARIYHENGMNERAVRILAGVLEKQPTDKEIIDLIKEYQEE